MLREPDATDTRLIRQMRESLFLFSDAVGGTDQYMAALRRPAYSAERHEMAGTLRASLERHGSQDTL